MFPVERPRVTLRFAATVAPYRPNNPHRGVDLAPWPGSTGRPIASVLAGIVVQERHGHRAWGNYVVTKNSLPRSVQAADLHGTVRTVRAGEPFYLLYAHMDTVAVRRGQNVAVGQQLGTIGDTGFSLGPHLHLEMRLGHHAARDVVNPLDMLTQTIAGLSEQLTGDVGPVLVA